MLQCLASTDNSKRNPLVHIYNASTCSRRMATRELEASLRYRVNSRVASARERNYFKQNKQMHEKPSQVDSSEGEGQLLPKLTTSV